jgi:hypothetical protein
MLRIDSIRSPGELLAQSDCTVLTQTALSGGYVHRASRLGSHRSLNLRIGITSLDVITLRCYEFLQRQFTFSSLSKRPINLPETQLPMARK